MNVFSFATAGEIRFGEGTADETGRIAAAFGTRAFVICGSDVSRAAPIILSLEKSGIRVEIFPTSGEPDFESLRKTMAAARRFFGTRRGTQDAVVVGPGGGSAMDLAKACGILLNNPGDPLEYAEIAGGGRLFTHASVPVIAIPTTAGSGSEVTRNAVIALPEKGIKISLRSAFMFPRVAIIDPELAYSLPPEATACGGMDALVQVLESFVSIKSNALSDSICQSALSLAATALPAAVATACSGTAPDAAGKKARADMAYVALCGGMVLANSGLGAVHGIAAPLGGTFGVPHGAACAALLAPACEANIRALRERESNSPALSRYRQLAIMLSGDASAKAEYLPVFLESLVANIGIKALSAFGVDQASIPGLVTAAQASNSMKGNPIKLTDAETAWIIGRAAAGFR